MPVVKSEVISTINDKFGEIYKVSGTISAVLINDADNTLVPLISAPGVGKIIHVLYTSFKLVYNSIPFGGTPGDGHLNYSDGTQLKVVLDDSILYGSTDGITNVDGSGQFFTTFPITIINTAVGFKVPTLIALGDSTIKYEIIYKIVDFS